MIFLKFGKLRLQLRLLQNKQTLVVIFSLFKISSLYQQVKQSKFQDFVKKQYKSAMYFCLKRLTRSISGVKLKEYYKILGVTPKSTEQQIKKQFHKLAKQYHPDTGKQKSQHKFKEVLQAYKYLVNPQNPREETSSTSQAHQESSQYEQQHEYKAQTKQQRIRRQTYEYFNRRRKPQYHRQESQDDRVQWSSFRNLIRGSPQLIVATLFIAFAVMTAVYTSRPMRLRHSVPERIFETEEEAMEYYRNEQLKKKQSFASRFNNKQRFERKIQRYEDDDD